MNVLHNENSRVRIPALVHLSRLKYEYVSLKDYSIIIDNDTNIFVDFFHESIKRINQTGLPIDDIQKIIA